MLPETTLNIPLLPIKLIVVVYVVLIAYTPVYTFSIAPVFKVNGTSMFWTKYCENGKTLFPMLLEALPPRKSAI